MKATVIYGPHDVRVDDVPDPRIHTPGDAIVSVVAACVCGSDLWKYRGLQAFDFPRRIGHELVGVVEEVGADVTTVRPGDFVIAPFTLSCGHCRMCQLGITTSCEHAASWGADDENGFFVDAAQGERVRVPMADGTLVPTPEPPDDRLVPALLTLSDVMGTGHHAAISAGVRGGASVVVVGDGAVGLCGVLAARRLGAARIVIMSRHEPRQQVARAFGATDCVAERGPAGAQAVADLLGGGADCVLECVGTDESLRQALDCARPGGQVGFVGLPVSEPKLSVREMFSKNVGVRGGVAPVRAYLPELLSEVWTGAIDPGPVFDLTVPLTDVAEAYAAMDERRSIKSLIRPTPACSVSAGRQVW